MTRRWRAPIWGSRLPFDQTNPILEIKNNASAQCFDRVGTKQARGGQPQKRLTLEARAALHFLLAKRPQHGDPRDADAAEFVSQEPQIYLRQKGAPCMSRDPADVHQGKALDLGAD